MFLIGEMGLVLLSALLISSFTVSAADGGLFGKTLVFPDETNDSYVELTPQKPMELKAFTLCMNVATELKGEREIILFAYRSEKADILDVWRERDGRYSFYLSEGGAVFEMPPLNPYKTHLCFTWDSKTGLSAVWVDGKRSIWKVYNVGHTIVPQGTVILGQHPKSYLAGFDEKQSFVGEVSDVNMWDYVLPETQIKALQSCATLHGPKGNIFDWETIQYQIHGEVLVAPAN